MRPKVIIFFLIAAILFLNTGCDSKGGSQLGGDHIVPYVQVYTEIPFGTGGDDILSWQNNARYFATSTPNPGPLGYKGHGIVVFTSDLEEFHCFDATCTKCADLNSHFTTDDLKGMVAECPECGTRYDLFTGNPFVTTEKVYPLKPYSITRVGKKLIVRN